MSNLTLGNCTAGLCRIASSFNATNFRNLTNIALNGTKVFLAYNASNFLAQAYNNSRPALNGTLSLNGTSNGTQSFNSTAAPSTFYSQAVQSIPSPSPDAILTGMTLLSSAVMLARYAAFKFFG